MMIWHFTLSVGHMVW